MDNTKTPMQQAKELMFQIALLCADESNKLSCLIMIAEEETPAHLEAVSECRGKHQKRLLEVLIQEVARK